MGKPLCIDLFCGLGGWSEAFLAEGYECVGYDIEAHDYGSGGYPGRLVLRDIRTIHGSEFRDAAVIVASPPCQAYSYRAMPWTRAKALPPPDNELFDACFRIQREASEAAGRHIPLIVENVRGAQKWVGMARWHYGSFFLWGDVPALMPIPASGRKSNPDGTCHPAGSWFAVADSLERGARSTKNDGGSWFAVAPHGGIGELNNPRDGVKLVGHANIRNGHAHTRHITNPRESEGVKVPAISFNGYGKPGYKAQGFNVTAAQAYREGVKFSQSGDAWFDGKPRDKMLADKGPAAFGSRSSSRKAASAMIAKIPFPLAQHIARTFYPPTSNAGCPGV